MGMIGRVELVGGRAAVELITTFSGCPALDLISSDIAAAVRALDGVTGVEVRPSAEAWDTSRLSDHARAVMASDFTVGRGRARQAGRMPPLRRGDPGGAVPVRPGPMPSRPPLPGLRRGHRSTASLKAGQLDLAEGSQLGLAGLVS